MLVSRPRDCGTAGKVALVSRPAVVRASSPALVSGAITESCGHGTSVPNLKFVEEKRKAAADPSTAFDAKNASNYAQDDSPFL
jgi:hypothetical protein